MVFPTFFTVVSIAVVVASAVVDGDSVVLEAVEAVVKAVVVVVAKVVVEKAGWPRILFQICSLFTQSYLGKRMLSNFPLIISPLLLGIVFKTLISTWDGCTVYSRRFCWTLRDKWYNQKITDVLRPDVSIGQVPQNLAPCSNGISNSHGVGNHIITILIGRSAEELKLCMT